LKISLQALPDVAQALIDKAHVVCPYSKRYPEYIDVRLVLA